MNLWSVLPDVIKVLIIAMSPFFELRLAIPMGIFNYGMGVYQSMIISIIGNIFIVIPVMIFLEYFVKFLMKKNKLCNKLFTKIFDKTRKRHSEKMELYGELALILIVAIPFPGTGAYTGALIAYLCGIPPRKAFPFIAIGVIIAGLIVTILSAGVDALI